MYYENRIQGTQKKKCKNKKEKETGILAILWFSIHYIRAVQTIHAVTVLRKSPQIYFGKYDHARVINCGIIKPANYRYHTANNNSVDKLSHVPSK